MSCYCWSACECDNPPTFPEKSETPPHSPTTTTTTTTTTANHILLTTLPYEQIHFEKITNSFTKVCDYHKSTQSFTQQTQSARTQQTSQQDKAVAMESFKTITTTKTCSKSECNQ